MRLHNVSYTMFENRVFCNYPEKEGEKCRITPHYVRVLPKISMLGGGGLNVCFPL